MSHVRITPQGCGITSKVEVDGHDISRAVRRVQVDLTAGHIPEVDIELAVLDVAPFEVESAQVLISPDVHDALVKLGWKPPLEVQG